HRDDDGEQDSQLARSVDSCSIDETSVDTHKEITQDQKVKRGDRSRQDERPKGVDQPETGDEQIRGNHSGTEEHRSHKEKQQSSMERGAWPGESVGGEGGYHHGQRRADASDKGRHEDRSGHHSSREQ